MRLTKIQITNIINTLTPFLGNHPASLRLFGSRVKDNLQGGDIDLLLLVPNNVTKQHLNQGKYEMRHLLRQQLGERRIDFLILSQQDTLKNPFLKLILPQSVEIYAWGSMSDE